MMNRRKFMKDMGVAASLGCLASLQGCFSPDQNTRSEKPNFLFVLADEMRQMDMSCSGNSDIKTPNMDRLAAEGAMFTRMFTPNPVCCPARSSMMTGLYPHKTGVYKNGLRMREDIPCIAEITSKAGYKTGHIGKWHLDGAAKGNKMYTPVPPQRHRGFEYWAGFEHGHKYWDGCYYTDSPEPVYFPQGTYEPDGQTDLALDFIRNNRDVPWHLDLSWGPPHFPIDEVKPEDRKRFDPAKLTLRPNVPKEFHDQARKDYANYYAMIENLDQNLGRILNLLDRLDLTENTIVIFTSDHGDMLLSHGQHYKRRPNEESIRVPFLIRYPKRIIPAHKTQTLATLVDVVPTCLELMGIDSIPTDGISFAPELTGKGSAIKRDSVYIGCNQLGCRDYDPGLYKMSPWRALRTDRYKACFLMQDEASIKMISLFDLEADPYEMNNLVGNKKYHKPANEMAQRMSQLSKRTNDKLFSNVKVGVSL